MLRFADGTRALYLVSTKKLHSAFKRNFPSILVDSARIQHHNFAQERPIAKRNISPRRASVRLSHDVENQFS